MYLDNKNYRQVFAWKQKDGRVVRAYMYNDPDNYHWCVIDGRNRYTFKNLTSMSKFCKARSYYPIIF